MLKQKAKSLFARRAFRRGVLAAGMLATPFTAFMLMQFVYGAPVWGYSAGIWLANALCLAVVYAALCAVLARPVAASLVCHLLAGLWGAANYFVAAFRGTPILPWDLTALGTAAAVAGSYDLTPTLRMLAALALLVAGAFLLRRQLGWRFRRWGNLALRAASGITAAALALAVSGPYLLDELGVKTDVWDPSASYRTGGALAVFLQNTRFMEVEQPDDVSVEDLERLVDSLPDDTAPLPAADEVPNVIAIMNESWADFEEWGNLSLSESVVDYIAGLDNAVWGHTYTSVFGAGTSASEFEFLTGNSMAFLPSGSIPYQQYILGPSDSLASLMKENGYRTLAIHPGERSSWQRDQAYPRLGFDDFKCADDLDVPVSEEHGYISDETSFDQVIWEYEHKAPGEKLFVFNVTIQNHGSYTVADYPAEVTLTDCPGRYPMAEQYLTLANKSDEAFQKLVEYFSACEEPTVIVMFGDHQPSVEQEFLDMAYGLTQDGMTMEQYMGKYRTPFVLWANYPLPETTIPDTSLNFLAQYLVRAAGIAPTTYGRYLWDLHQTIPALTFVGYTDAEGNAYSHLETNDFTALIRQYQAMQYNNLFGENQRRSDWFSNAPALA